MKYQVGQRGTDNFGVICYVAVVKEVPDVIGTTWSYWVVDDEGGKPGSGCIRHVDLGGFVGFPNERPVTLPAEVLDQLVVPGFERFAPVAKKRRRAA